MLEQGFIQNSTSPYSSSILLVKKKDGSWHFCVNYRALNQATIKDEFPTLIINKFLEELCGATIFSKLDLRADYFHIWMHHEDVGKIVFQTHDDHYEFFQCFLD